MFNVFKKKTIGQKITWKIEGMHCTSCAMNIDGALEETKGVITANTSYAKSQVTIEYDPEHISIGDLEKVIKKEGYTVKNS
jgi:copper chaperone CopZ